MYFNKIICYGKTIMEKNYAIMEKLSQFSWTLNNNADARNQTFERNNGTFKQPSSHKYSRWD